MRSGKPREVHGLGHPLVPGRVRMQVAELTSEVAPIPEYVAFAGMAAGVALTGAVASEGPKAVRAVEEHLTDVWMRLLRAGPR
jgi:hypothetical protein